MRIASQSRHLYHAISTVLLALGIVLALLVALAVLPRISGLDAIAVKSASARAALLSSDLAVTKGVSPASLTVGDVVAYRSGDHLVNDSIVQVKQTEYGPVLHMKGNAPGTEDTLALIEGIDAAKVVFSIPYLGFLVDFSDSTFGKVPLIVGPMLFLLLLLARRRELNKIITRQGVSASVKQIETAKQVISWTSRREQAKLPPQAPSGKRGKR